MFFTPHMAQAFLGLTTLVLACASGDEYLVEPEAPGESTSCFALVGSRLIYFSFGKAERERQGGKHFTNVSEFFKTRFRFGGCDFLCLLVQLRDQCCKQVLIY